MLASVLAREPHGRSCKLVQYLLCPGATKSKYPIFHHLE